MQDKLSKINEVLIIPVMDIFTDKPHMFMPYRVVCDCVGSSRAMFYVVTPTQLIAFKTDSFTFADPEKAKLFNGWIRLETNLSNISHNPYLARNCVVDIWPIDSNKAREIMDKMERTPRVDETGQIWHMCSTANNNLVLDQFPETYDTISTCDVESEQWVDANSKDVLKHKLTDSSTTMHGSVSLWLKFCISPAEAEAIANDQLATLELCMKFFKEFKQRYYCYDRSLTSLEQSIKIPIRLYNYTGDLLYKGSGEGEPIQLVRSPNGRYYPLKNSGPPSFATPSALAQLGL
jgi:hypothetical protein